MISKYPVIISNTGEEAEAVIKEVVTLNDEKWITVRLYTKYIQKFFWFIKIESKQEVHYCKFDPIEWSYDYIDMIKRTVEKYEEKLAIDSAFDDIKKDKLAKLEEWDGVQ